MYAKDELLRGLLDLNPEHSTGNGEEMLVGPDQLEERLAVVDFPVCHHAHVDLHEILDEVVETEFDFGA